MNPYNTLLIVSAFMVALSGCKEKSTSPVATDTLQAERVMHEAYRPQLHFSPKEKWMNDPNGMFYFEGDYHLFYQYYPEGTKWGPMHWGHAISQDLVHWEHLPIALYPDSTGYIFSGSAVVDRSNTSGLAKSGEVPIVAFYTIHDPKKEKAGRIDYQTQAMAYSLDKGRTWKKYDENPVLSNPGINDFRDPKVSWHASSKQWIMTLAVKDHISFYGSSDLKNWKKLSDFGSKDGEHGGVWECPDLLTLKDEHGAEKSVLLVSINPGGPNRGSATQYFVGHFDGKKFISDTPGGNSGWMDYGPDNYAGVTFDNIPSEDGRCILIGWMSNWLYAEFVPSEKWRSAMTIPRTLTLKSNGKGHALLSYPVKEVDKIAGTSASVGPAESDTIDLSSMSKLNVGLSRISGKIKKGDFTFVLSNSKGHTLRFGLNTAENKFFVDRSASGNVEFHPEFKRPLYAPRIMDGEWIDFTMIIDVASIELFFDHGATVMTIINFPDGGYSNLKVYGKDQSIAIDSVVVEELSGIW